MAMQLTKNFEKPGQIGATCQLCFKLVSKYQCLAVEGYLFMVQNGQHKKLH